jgi:hypothetical protein
MLRRGAGGVTALSVTANIAKTARGKPVGSAAVAIAIWGALRPKTYAAISAEEITNYASEPFLTEPDLWRVHVRSLVALHCATADAQEAGNLAAEAVERSLGAFLAGLAFSLLALVTLLVALI